MLIIVNNIIRTSAPQFANRNVRLQRGSSAGSQGVGQAKAGECVCAYMSLCVCDYDSEGMANAKVGVYCRKRAKK